MSKSPKTLTGVYAIVLLRPTHAVAAIPVHARELECFLARKQTPGRNRDMLVFPGGGVRHGFDVEGELLRETRAESGLGVTPIHAQPYLFVRKPNDSIGGSRYKLFVLCTPTSATIETPRSQELVEARYRSVGHILDHLGQAMAPAYFEALNHFEKSGVLKQLAAQPSWEAVPLRVPQLPPEALQPVSLAQLCA